MKQNDNHKFERRSTYGERKDGQTVGCKLSRAELDRLEALGAEYGLSRSDLIRSFILSGMEVMEAGQVSPA